ncbi:MAG: hypothetical protein IJN50_02825 [Clostridia bacterium]|nr:hypothetical protein [Clostridia bacterium]
MRSFLEITLKNGCFTGTNGLNVTEFKNYTVKGNGWECYIERSGRIFCRTVEEDKIIHYTITTAGYFTITYIEVDKVTKVLKEGYITDRKKGLENGTIFLSDGPITKRVAFFRSVGLQDFQNKYGINGGIKKLDPNTIYSVRNAHCNNLETSGDVIPDIGTFCEIITDGTKEKIGEVWGNTEELKERFPNCNAFELEEMFEVKDATWVIKHVKTWNEDKVTEYRILYSKENYTQIEIPDNYKVI